MDNQKKRKTRPGKETAAPIDPGNHAEVQEKKYPVPGNKNLIFEGAAYS